MFIRLCSLAQSVDCSTPRGGASRASAPTALVRGMMHGMRLVGRAQRPHWPGPCCPEESGICPCGCRVEAGQWRSCRRAVGHESADILEPPAGMSVQAQMIPTQRGLRVSPHWWAQRCRHGGSFISRLLPLHLKAPRVTAFVVFQNNFSVFLDYGVFFFDSFLC